MFNAIPHVFTGFIVYMLYVFYMSYDEHTCTYKCYVYVVLPLIFYMHAIFNFVEYVITIIIAIPSSLLYHHHCHTIIIVIPSSLLYHHHCYTIIIVIPSSYYVIACIIFHVEK